MSRRTRSRRIPRSRGYLVALAILVVVPMLDAGPLVGQYTSSECQLMDTFRTLQSRQVSPGVSIVWISRPDLRCPNGLRIRADSAVVFEQTGRSELIGNVRFTNAERDLRSDQADWYERDRRLFARGNVVFGTTEGDSEIRGDTLVYLEARDGSGDHVTVSGGRPSALLRPGDQDADTEPYLVTANRLRLQGEDFFWGDGDVEVERSDLSARSDSLAYDRAAGNLILSRDAVVTRDDVTARGGVVTLRLEEERLRSVVARRRGSIETEDLVLSGVNVEIELDENEEVTSILAEGGEDPETEDYIPGLMTGESLFIRGDRVTVEDEVETGLRVLIATGDARAESLGDGFGSDGERTGTDDGSEPPIPDPDADDAPAEGSSAITLDRDWIEGSEIRAWLEEIEDDGDEEETAWRLVRIEATTNARAFYRSPPDRDDDDDIGVPDTDLDEDAPPEPPARSISYILADLIILHLVDGEVSVLEAEGNVRGQQLEPRTGSADRTTMEGR